MTIEKIHPSFERLSFSDYQAKIDKLSTDLDKGLWMTTNCETQVKSHKIVRWIKCFLSVFLPIEFFASIKVSKVAQSYFQFLKTHVDYLEKTEDAEKAKLILNKLDKKTQGKYSTKINLILDAIDGIKSKQIPLHI